MAMVKNQVQDCNLYRYRVIERGDWKYWDCAARNPSPFARDFWFIPADNDTVAISAVDDDNEGYHHLVTLRARSRNMVRHRETYVCPYCQEGYECPCDPDGDQHCYYQGGSMYQNRNRNRNQEFDQNFYLYFNLQAGDWNYWDCAARNPSPLARDMWCISGDNDTALFTTGGNNYLATVRNQNGDRNFYLYNNLRPGDWNYWDCLARNPSPLARDLWVVPQGNDMASICAVDTTGDGTRESLFVVKNQNGDFNAYLWNMPEPGDWTYWDCLARNPSPLARDFWSIPGGNDIGSVVPARTAAEDDICALRVRETQQNLYRYRCLVRGDWTYWDCIARNPSPMARDLWVIKSGNCTCCMQ